MPNKKQLRVFLCHARQDEDAARDLYSRLKSDGIDPWLDKEKLLPGRNWDEEIRKSVQSSDIVLVCHSKSFSRAGYRQKEVRIALETAELQPPNEIFIIPARFEDCKILPSLTKWQWVDLFDERGYRMLMLALSERAQKHGIILNFKQKSRSSTVKDIMTKRLITVRPDDTIELARRKMEAKNVDCVLIPPKGGGKLWRIFTKTDLLIALDTLRTLDELSVARVMGFSSTVTCVARPEWMWAKALEEMVKHGVKHLPVMDRSGTIIGIISSDDIVYS